MSISIIPKSHKAHSLIIQSEKAHMLFILVHNLINIRLQIHTQDQRLFFTDLKHEERIQKTDKK